MKTLRTIAAIIVAAVLVFGPTVAFAAGETVNVATNSGTYSTGSVIQVSGTVSPAPAASNTAVVVTTKGPAGAVDTGTANVATGSGAYTYTFVAGGSTLWVTGTYTVNATYGGPGGTGSGTATFAYTASSIVGGGGGNPTTSITVQVTATTPVAPGGAETVAILTSFTQNGSLAAATFQTIHYHTPAGTLVTLCSSASGPSGCTGTFTTIHKGFYTIDFTAPQATGGYFVHAWTNGPTSNQVSSGQGQGLGSFTVAAFAGATSTTGGGGGNTAVENQILSNLTNIRTTLSGVSSSLTVVTNGFSSINNALTTITTQTQGLSGVQASLNTISTGVSGITNTLSGVSTGLTQLGGISGQLTTLNNAISNNQTYVLVVAALAAITLVLELAILVRKLS